MPASLRELRERNQSVRTTQKMTRAMELIAASRITKAHLAAEAALPYTRELNHAVAAVAAHPDVSHPLTTEPEEVKRSAMLVITSDRGLAGPYSANVLKMADNLTKNLEEKGREIVTYVTGRKGVSFYTYRGRNLEKTWTGFSDKPTHEISNAIADELIDRFLAPAESGGVDEIEVVYTRFDSMLVQEPRVRRILPLQVVSGHEAHGLKDIYVFEPDATSVLDALLRLYVQNRIHFYMMQAAASELASKQKAMKSATDNAQQLIDNLTRQINQARQAKITQEITEIVGGAAALTE